MHKNERKKDHACVENEFYKALEARGNFENGLFGLTRTSSQKLKPFQATLLLVANSRDCSQTGSLLRGWASQVALVVKNLPANPGDLGDVGSIPGSGRSPGEGNGNPLQYSCLENPLD